MGVVLNDASSALVTAVERVLSQQLVNVDGQAVASILLT